MAKQLQQLSTQLSDFIKNQKVFFVATAAKEGRINVSPKGLDSLRILGPNKIIWLNLTGSGNETAAHVKLHNRMTIMFCAFEGNPLILRLYGKAKVLHRKDQEYKNYITNFSPSISARQIFEFDIDLVQTSCGFGVPLMDFNQDRSLLPEWADRKGEEGIQAYWKEKNTKSIDNFDTHILD